ncbi:MAG TPA: ABC transporter permease, partial [Lachnospiraceae bacterium]|nr:ABC transporter permease [Lachnospiraceae bacterium]
MKSNRLKWLAAPYGVWAAGFIIIPLVMIVFYAFTSQETGGFTLANFDDVFTGEVMKALGLSLGLALVSTLIC